MSAPTKCAAYQGEFESFKDKVKTQFDAIEYGMRFENESIIFFNELAFRITGEQKDAIRKPVDEEKKHLVYLKELRSEQK